MFRKWPSQIFVTLAQALGTLKVDGIGSLPSFGQNSKAGKKRTEVVGEATAAPEHIGSSNESAWAPLSPSPLYNCCFPGYGLRCHFHSESWILLPDYWHQMAPTWHPVYSVSASIPSSRSGSCGSPGVLCLLVTRQCLEWQLKAKKKGENLKAFTRLFFRAFFTVAKGIKNDKSSSFWKYCPWSYSEKIISICE